MPVPRYYHPAPPSKTLIKAERTFEGISLDIPGQSAKMVTSMSSRFQLCPACYQAESRWVFIFEVAFAPTVALSINFVAVASTWV